LFGEILGIFLGEQQLQYTFLKRELNRWSRQEATLYSEIGGRSCIERLGSFLGQIKYKRGRRICIALPRNRYYLRDLKFKGLSTEEAENAVRLSIATHVHLPLEDIYFDCWSYQKGQDTHVLVAYAKRIFIDSIIEQVERAGHKKGLFCISPCSLGNDILLRKAASVSFPCISLHKEDEYKVVNLHGVEGWQGCHLIRGQEKDITQEIERIGFRSKDNDVFFVFGQIENTFLHGKTGTDPCSDSTLKPLCGGGKWDIGLSAAALGISAFPQIAFEQKPRKKPLYLRVNALQLILVGILVLLLLFTGARFYQLVKISRQYSKNVAMVKALEERFAPLRAKLERLQDLKAIEQDMIDFLRERPSLLEILRELAEKTPSDAWIKYFTLRNNVLKVSAEGGSAVSTMEAWRRSNLFVSVKLASPVTKDRQGKERYTVELRLKQFLQAREARR